MIIDKDDQVFNLMDTNGRRSDVVNAYTIYMEILRDLADETGDLEFKRYPISWKQFQFYREAITRSPNTFKSHPIYDKFVTNLEKQEYREAFEKRDLDSIRLLPEGNDMLKILDNGIEDRARHYTSNLVKIGFTDDDRRISPIGRAFVDGKNVDRDNFENLLPISDTNLIFLRQLLKLRVYGKKHEFYYSPMMMCLYILSQCDKISTSVLAVMIQMINPAYVIDPKTFVQNVLNTTVEEVAASYINYSTTKEYKEVSAQTVPMDKKYFETVFKSRKSGNTPEYYQFYKAYVAFMDSKSEKNLKIIYDIWNKNKAKINKAFGFNSNVFNFDNKTPTNVAKFLENNKDNEYLLTDNINSTVYKLFMGSKRHDIIGEYSDTFLRLLSVTGIVSMKNGIATLKYRDLWLKLFEKAEIKNFIFGETTEKQYKEYEKNGNSPFFSHISTEIIFGIAKTDSKTIVKQISDELNVTSADEARVVLKSKVNTEFVSYIQNNYPKERVIELLDLFSSRDNDPLIQEAVESTASVPTIFEYIVGIAWYYISEKNYDVFSSFNLAMNADFIPETHAGGGSGDIVINYHDKVVMLEVTLMNKQAQKRGEWEPVLRHATNLTIEQAPKDVVTLFVADELDDNTINIWRAVASVPLKSSKVINSKGEYAENVTIMPLRNKELGDFLRRGVKEKELLEKVRTSFGGLSLDFDLEWRHKIMTEI